MVVLVNPVVAHQTLVRLLLQIPHQQVAVVHTPTHFHLQAVLVRLAVTQLI
jgi:hypothetical protein